MGLGGGREVSGEGTLRASYKVHRCVCVCPATGRGRAAPGGAGREPPGGHAGRRASLKKETRGGGRHGQEAGREPQPLRGPGAGGMSPLALVPAVPAVSPPCRAGTHPAGSAHDFFFFSFSACSQCGGEPSDLGAWSCITKIPPKHAQRSPGGFSQSPGGTPPTGPPRRGPAPQRGWAGREPGCGQLRRQPPSCGFKGFVPSTV